MGSNDEYIYNMLQNNSKPLCPLKRKFTIFGSWYETSYMVMFKFVHMISLGLNFKCLVVTLIIMSYTSKIICFLLFDETAKAKKLCIWYVNCFVF